VGVGIGRGALWLCGRGARISGLVLGALGSGRGALGVGSYSGALGREGQWPLVTRQWLLTTVGERVKWLVYSTKGQLPAYSLVPRVRTHTTYARRAQP
jgi:hypothetical protein